LIPDEHQIAFSDPIFDSVVPTITLTNKSEAWSRVNEQISDLDRAQMAGNPNVEEWVSLGQMLYYFEDERLILDPTESDLAQHKTWISSLQRIGHQMLTTISPQDQEEVVAHLSVLRLRELGWHGKMDAAEASQLLGEVFGGDSERS
jgi:hypothetical protein